ncbi:MAG: MBL fold metallo-hydrolase [Chloroflexota bacterium]|nr:MBL fold metallo-hydrolase [Chloroflexota bacterium]
MEPLGEGADRGGTKRNYLHLLDCGPDEYGDALLARVGDVSVLIDGSHPGDYVTRGGHPSVPEQLGRLLGQKKPPYEVSLLIVTHGHQDHIGCLPKLVADDQLRAEWALVIDPDLAWGGGSGVRADAELPASARTLFAALREEPRSPRSADNVLAQFLEDSVTLEDRYRGMLGTLEERGTKVTRYKGTPPAQLLQTFRSIGLEVLGPSAAMLQACSGHLSDAADALIPLTQDALVGDGDLLRAYRSLIGGWSDAVDASQRLGAMVNCQSIVTVLQAGGDKLLLGGDMQFADPQVQDQAVADGMAQLRKAIADRAPYRVAKLSHHGSDNGVSDQILNELGTTRLFGICAGAGSTHHPNPTTLQLLDSRKRTIQWARTDHNGLSTFELRGASTRVTVTSGQLNDAQPNSTDTASPSATMAPTLTTRATRDDVEVITHLPNADARVTVSIAIETPGSSLVSPVRGPDANTATSFAVGGGRTLPPLLFVTNRDRLTAAIGTDGAQATCAALQVAGETILDLPATSDEAIAAVRERLQARPDLVGVVLVGSHTVAPARRVDALPAALRARIGFTDDADDFVVWSDDPYTDYNGDGMPELPVSRIPDGRSAALVQAALSATRPEGNSKSGIRNIARPFAVDVFTAIAPTGGDLLVSHPTVFNVRPPYELSASAVYLMLHGDYTDSSRFWGEQTPQHLEAVNVTNIPDRARSVVFTGCCWGALTVDPPAGRWVEGQSIAPKTPEGSIALRFLQSGALAFVGCTGSHYSPNRPPFTFFGGPMHSAFWRAYQESGSPAQALREAKIAYAQGLPHGQEADQSRAIEYKILRQYTCLGLGW